MKRILSYFLLCTLLFGIFSCSGLLPGARAAALPSATAQEVDALFNGRSKDIHPRILANSADFARIRRLIQTDPYMTVWYARLYEYCVAQLAEPLCKYELPDGVRLLEISRVASKRITFLSMGYQLSGEQRFAQRAVEEMLNVSSFPDWHPAHYLDTAQMAYGVGIGYDWLYHYMDSSQRNTIATALYTYAVATSLQGQSYQTNHSNWNPWCHGGVSVAASAIYESYPANCASYLASVVKNIQCALNVLTPSGAYPEGPGYYTVGTQFAVIALDTLQSVLGTDFGLSEIDGFRDCGSYLLTMNGNLRTFNFGDGGSSFSNGAFLHWFANRYHMPELSAYQQIGAQNDEVLSLIWYNPDLVADYTAGDRQLDRLLYSNEYESVAAFRSNNAAGIYAAIKSGNNQSNHSDLDAGTFVLEALGQIWMEELGAENYNLPGYWGMYKGSNRWKYYRKRTEGQNLMVLNPDAYGGQDHDAKCQILDYESGYDGGYATVDLTDAYDGSGGSSFKRGLLLFDNRSRVLVRDEITCSKTSTAYWFGHTKAAITLSSDSKTAELTLNGKTLLAQIASPSNAKFTVMDAEPLSSSPNPSGQDSREGYRKLAIHITGLNSVSVSVVFTPILQESDRNKALPTAAISEFSSLISPYAPNTSLQKDSSGIYEIRSVEDFAKFAEMVNSGTTFHKQTVKLMCDLDLKGRSIPPVGGCGSENAFWGTFDGGNHVIRNLFQYEPEGVNVGLFGHARYATIKNLGIESGTVFCKEKSAGLIGFAHSVTLNNCFNRAKLVGFAGYNGGLIGQLGGTSTIDSCYNHSIVSSQGPIAGGIVGYINSGSVSTLRNCYHTGQLSDTQGRCAMIGSYNTEGINLIQKLTVSNCYSTEPIKSSAVADNSTMESYTNCQTLRAPQLVSSAITLGSSYISDCQWENDGFPVFTWQCETTLPSDLRLSTAAQLRRLAYEVNSGKNNFDRKTITLTADIDLDSREWIPIGGNTTADSFGPIFRGTFDGQGYSIRNLRISTGYNYVGFFGSVEGHIRNLGIQSGLVEGGVKAAGLAGYLKGSMEQCFNRATVKGSNTVGGLVGMSAASQIRNCYNHGPITSSAYAAGGIVAYYSSASKGSVIENCYHVGTLTASIPGGICGNIHSSLTTHEFRNCYTVEGTAILGSGSTAILSNCRSMSASALKNSDEIPGSLFHRDYVIPSNGGYPILNAFVYKGEALPTLTPDEKGIYNIHTEQQLRSLAYMVNEGGNTFAGKTVKLCADIDLGNREWIPIGGNVPIEDMTIPSFNGIFDGGGHVISNLSISTGNRYVGLFGSLVNAKLQNFGIESGVIFGAEKIGGVAGSIRSASTLRNCYNKANLSGNNITGGIVGMVNASNNVIEACYNTGSVSAKNSAAGIVGYCASGTRGLKLLNCYNSGIGSNGILGTANQAATELSMDNCHSISAVPLVGTGNALVASNSTQKSLAELRDSASTLGQGYREDYFTKNTLLPVLAWENGSHSTALKQVNGVYQISSPEDLRLLSYLVRKGSTFNGKTLVLTTDIDLQNKPWLPIGGADELKTYEFQGQFDGRGYVIRNLYSNQWNQGYAGLFGIVRYGKVRNVGIESGFVIGKSYVGGITGYVNSGATVSSCYNKAFIGADRINGGIAGMAGSTGTVIENCYNTGRICEGVVTSTAGGIIGYLSSGVRKLDVRNCYNVGNLYGIINSVNPAATNVTITNSYSAGTQDLLREFGCTQLSNCHQVTEAVMKTYATVLGAAFDTDTKGINKGYPILTWESGKLCFHEYSSGITAPTCTAQGYTTHTCSRCSHSYKDTYTNALGHNYTNYKASTNPTTSATGVLTGTCSRCNGTTTVTLPKLNTTDYTKTTTTAATCTATGVDKYTWKTTTYGTFSFNATTAALGHSYTTKVTAPTCTAQGYTTHTCSRCSHSYKDTYVAAKGHTEVIDKAVAATCTTAGKTEGKHCSVCSAVLVAQQTIPAKGHTEVIDKAVTATCTASGKTEGKHCSVCSAVLVAQQTIPAKGHTEVIDKAVAATCTTAGKTEGKHCSVCSAVLIAQQTVPAKGHSYSYTKINALSHLVICKNCNTSTEAAHSYKDGFCLCGEPEIKEPVENTSLKLNHSLNLASDISVNLLISKSLLEGFDLNTVFVESTIDLYEGNRHTGTTTLRTEPVENGNYYYFTLTGLTAIQMNDSISSILYGTKEGQPYYSPVDEYSIAAYAYSQMNNPDRSHSLKTLCADLLRYGAKAQIFKAYRTDSLADGSMTELHKSYLSDMESVSFGNTNKVLNDLPNAPIQWAGKSLNLESKVALKFVFKSAGYTGDLSKLSLKVLYADIQGNPKTLSIPNPRLYNPDSKLYAFTLDSLLAAELRAVVSVQIYEGNTPLSPTLQYSADTYGNNRTGDLLTLCKALFAYSDSAKAYFVNQ